ncbi:hypothetical protein NDU88_009944 [Pleurodeles waltl]|uniref:Uncharacterized protein n=1 Tax=Pleurodeles waltl TaxID=8319 RepID=A0AAV7RWQ2_PLEWA|nr:hypothetical protein NDU88_009944 [Pleurodeles waltl]
MGAHRGQGCVAGSSSAACSARSSGPRCHSQALALFNPGRPRYYGRPGPSTASVLPQEAKPPGFSPRSGMGRPSLIRWAALRRNRLPLVSGHGPQPQRPGSSCRASGPSPRTSQACRYPAAPRFNPVSGRGSRPPARDPRQAARHCTAFKAG